MDTGERASLGDASTLEARVRPRSAMSAGRLNASTMSMRAKAKRKREANAQHNSNFRAGYVPVDEEVLHKSGLRGRKRYFLYCVIAVLMIIALLNALVTAWLIYLLGLTHHGATSLELTDIGSRHFLRVLVDASIVSVSVSEEGFLGARYNSSIHFTASEGVLKIEEHDGSDVVLEDGKITLSADEVSVYTKDGGAGASLNAETLANQASNLYVADTAVVSKMQSLASFRNLSIESVVHDVELQSQDDVNFRSKGGVSIGGSSVILQANDKILLDGRKGVFVDPNLLEISTAKGHKSAKAFKLCVCETGKIFKVRNTGQGTSCDLGQDLHVLCAS